MGKSRHLSFLTSNNLLRVHYSQVLESLEVQNANTAAYANLYFEMKNLLVADTNWRNIEPLEVSHGVNKMKCTMSNPFNEHIECSVI